MAIDKITTASITDANITTAKLAYNAIPFRNIIINGDMSIAQRATSKSSVNSVGYYTVDRWRIGGSSTTSGTWTQSQDTTVPSGQGFAKSFKMDCTTAKGTLDAGSQFKIEQKIEGQNLQYLKKGTSSAESTTLSFWVYATKTGTNICQLVDTDNSRSISQAYTISSANTWEKKTLTFAGDTSGAFTNDNATSLEVKWWITAGTTYSSGTLNTSWNSITNANTAVGQVNHADSTSNNFYMTGVQLEAGTTASDFEFLPVDVNFYRCARYYLKESQGRYGAAIDYSNGASSDVNWDIRAVSQFRSDGYTVTYTQQNASATVQRKGQLGFNITGSATSTSGGAYLNTGWEVSDEL